MGGEEEVVVAITAGEEEEVEEVVEEEVEVIINTGDAAKADQIKPPQKTGTAPKVGILVRRKQQNPASLHRATSHKRRRSAEHDKKVSFCYLDHRIYHI